MGGARQRIIVDTNVVFEGLTQRGSSPGLLAQRSASTYRITPVAESSDAQQKNFELFRTSLPSASMNEVWKILDEREPVMPSSKLSPKSAERLARQITKARQAAE